MEVDSWPEGCWCSKFIDDNFYASTPTYEEDSCIPRKGLYAMLQASTAGVSKWVCGG